MCKTKMPTWFVVMYKEQTDLFGKSFFLTLSCSLLLSLSCYHLSTLFLLSRSTEVERMNSTLSNTSITCVRDTSVTAVVFPCLYSLVFLVALVLNSLAAWIFFNIPSASTFVVYLKHVVRDQRFYQTLICLSVSVCGGKRHLINNLILC